MIAIMQPTFLPWIGYFDLIDQVKHFVFLDNVQFSKQSWQQRNRISTTRGLEWISIPVTSTGLEQLIMDVRIGGVDYPKKIINKIEETYNKHPYFDQYWGDLKVIFSSYSRGDLISSLNIELITTISEVLGIESKFEVASEINNTSDRIQRLIDINKHFNSEEYISPMGAFDYIADNTALFVRNNINVKFHNFIHPKYQVDDLTFHPYASIIDLLFTRGEKSIEIIRSGRDRLIGVEELKYG